jgi:DNA-binding phage protein
MSYETLSAELLRALRGKRTRPGFSQFLGYKSNIAQRWEAGRCWPTATSFFALCRRLRLDPEARVGAFLQQSPAWLAGADFSRSESVAALLEELRGRTPVRLIAERCGYNRFSVSRWLSGDADPRLPHLLALIEACSRRVLDFIAAFVDPALLPSASRRWQQLTLMRHGAYARPLSHAVLRALELDDYRAGGHREPNYLASKTGATAEQVQEALEFLSATGQIKKTRRGYRPEQIGVVDTGVDPGRARALRLTWTRLALERLEAGGAGQFGYSLFAISRQDLQRLQRVQAAYLREMQAIIAGSQANDCVGLYCAQLLDLGSGEENAFAAGAER